MQQHFKIIGSGTYLPKICLSAEDVDKRANLPEGWTRRHAGVLKRYQCAAPDSLASMARHAATAALENAGLQWKDIDLILDASASRQQPIPCNASLLQQAFGKAASGIPCMDIQSTCLSFVMALHVANGLFSGDLYRHILIVSSEAALQGVNWQEPESACILGDGAAAVIVKKTAPQAGYFFAHQSFSEYADVCRVRGGGGVLTPFEYSTENDADFRFHMDGGKIFRIARKRLPPMVKTLLKTAKLTMKQIHVVPHQASPKSLAIMGRWLNVDPQKFYQSIEQHGNMVAAGIPYVLSQCLQQEKIIANDPVMLLGTSAGYSQAGLIFRMR